jgi:inositol-phosphate transport system substrate-binding protein
MERRLTRRELVARSALVGAGLLASPPLARAALRTRAAIPLRAWSQVSPNVDIWRNRALAVAAAKTAEVDLETQDYEILWPEYLNKVTLAASAGDAPNIVVAGHELAAPWAQSGWIVPLESRSVPGLNQVFPGLWNSVEVGGRTWGVPIEPEARPMFFNKTRLRRLGWSAQQVKSLPHRLRDGTFTLDDFIHTARLAVDRDVVPRGYAYWHRPQPGFDFLQYYVAYGGKLYDEDKRKLVLRRKPLLDFYAFQRRVVDEGLTPHNFIGTDFDVWHRTVARGDVLFWNGGIWNWAEWKTRFVGSKGEDYLFGFIGYGLQPTGIKGKPGRTLSRPLAYFVTSKDASGASDDQIDAAWSLIARSMTKETRTPEVLRSAHLAWLTPQLDSPAYRRDRFLSSVTYMLQHGRAFFIPNDPNFALYNTIVYDGMLRAEGRELSPRSAADAAVARMRAELGSAVIYE